MFFFESFMSLMSFTSFKSYPLFVLYSGLLKVWWPGLSKVEAYSR